MPKKEKIAEDDVIDLDTKDLERILKARKREEKEIKIKDYDKLMKTATVFLFWITIGILIIMKNTSFVMFLITGILVFIHFEMVYNAPYKTLENTKK